MNVIWIVDNQIQIQPRVKHKLPLLIVVTYNKTIGWGAGTYLLHVDSTQVAQTKRNSQQNEQDNVVDHTSTPSTLNTQLVNFTGVRIVGLDEEVF